MAGLFDSVVKRAVRSRFLYAFNHDPECCTRGYMARILINKGHDEKLINDAFDELEKEFEAGTFDPTKEDD